MSVELPEPFVDATRAADFLSLKPRRILELARSGDLPGYPLGHGAHRVWRFRLTELTAAMSQLANRPSALVAPYPEMSYGSRPAKRSARRT